jgi:hypothetical protein
MKRAGWILAVAVALAGLGRQAAAQTDSISVTVSLAEVVSVSVTPNAWNIGPIALSGTNGPTSFTATVGNTATQLDILGSNAAGGWTLADTPGLNQFVVSVASPAITLTTAYQALAASVPAYGSQDFALTYQAPSSDNIGGGVSQAFTVTVRASAAP